MKHAVLASLPTASIELSTDIRSDHMKAQHMDASHSEPSVVSRSLYPPDEVAVQARVSDANRTRDANGELPIWVTITRRIQADPVDDIFVLQHATATFTGATFDEANTLTSGLHDGPERRVLTHEALAVACAIARTEGGYVPSSGGAGSTPALLAACVADSADGELRRRWTPEPQDRTEAASIRTWGTLLAPGNHFEQGIRFACRQDHLAIRELGIAATALPTHARALRHHRELTDPGATPPWLTSKSHWLSREGDPIEVAGVVDRLMLIPRVGDDGRANFAETYWLFGLRTPAGCSVYWTTEDEFANPVPSLQRGTHVTVYGTVASHTTFGKEQSTKLSNCTITIEP